MASASKSDSDPALGALLKSRKQAKAKLRRLETFCDGFNLERDSITSLKAAISRLEQIMKDYDDIQGNIELIEDDPSQQDRSNFETKYLALYGRLHDL